MFKFHVFSILAQFAHFAHLNNWVDICLNEVFKSKMNELNQTQIKSWAVKLLSNCIWAVKLQLESTIIQTQQQLLLPDFPLFSYF